jgi:hypothetical protein
MLAESGFEQFSPDYINQSQMALFDAHYLLMHHLHHLRLDWLENKHRVMDICLARITIQPYHSGNPALQIPQPMADFYLNYREKDKIDESALKQMLESFWRQYAQHVRKPSQVDQALAQLSLDQHAKWADIKKRYHTLAHRHHPDKGGNPGYFADIQQAFEHLKGHYGQ